MRERIVISTVADLANGGNDASQPKSVALRVKRMETHFEPAGGGARLVEADLDPAGAGSIEPASLADAMPVDDRGNGPRPAFGEILQRLGRTVSSAGNGTPAGAESNLRLDADAASEADAVSAADEGSTATPETDSSPRSGNRQAAFVEAKPIAVSAPSGVPVQHDAPGPAINLQIAERIVAAFAPDGTSVTPADTATANAANGRLRMNAGGAALKTLSIQLEPEALGRLDVSMRLVNGRLAVELAASEASTARAIAEDRQGLRKILEHAGFALDDAAITVVARDVAPLGSTVADGATGSDRRDTSGDRAGDGRPGQQSQPDARERRDARDRQAADAGSVYL